METLVLPPLPRRSGARQLLHAVLHDGLGAVAAHLLHELPARNLPEPLSPVASRYQHLQNGASAQPGAAPCLQERNHAVSRGDLARSRDHFRFFALPESSIACDPDPQRNQRPHQQEQGVGDVLESDRRDVLQAELTDLLRDVPFKQYQETLSRPSFLLLSLQTTTRSRPKPTSSRASSRRTSPRTLKTRASN